MKFSVDEMNVISIYDTSDKTALISRLKEILPHIEDTELAEITASAINKLELMSDEEFNETEFEPVLTPEDKGVYNNEQN